MYMQLRQELERVSIRIDSISSLHSAIVSKDSTVKYDMTFSRYTDCFNSMVRIFTCAKEYLVSEVVVSDTPWSNVELKHALSEVRLIAGARRGNLRRFFHEASYLLDFASVVFSRVESYYRGIE